MAEYWIYPEGVGPNTWDGTLENQATENIYLDATWVTNDGWITKISSVGGGNGGTVPATNVLYDNDFAREKGHLAWQTWADGAAWHTQDVAAVRTKGQQFVYPGFWRDPRYTAKYGVSSAGSGRTSSRDEGLTGPPSSLASWSLYSYGLQTSAYFVENATPKAPAFLTGSPAEGSTISDPDPVFAAQTPHPAADDAYDATDRVQYVVAYWNAATSQWVTSYNTDFLTTDREKLDSSFSRRLGLALVAGRKYRVQFRHMDSWGVWSDWSAYRTFTISTGPNPPTLTSPAENEKVDTAKPANYQGTYSHPQNLALTNVQIQIWNSNTSVKLYDSGVLAHGNAANWTIGNAWHPNLSWGTRYQWRAATQDSAAVWSSWSDWGSFRLNAAPNQPRNPSPVNGQATSSATMRASVSDPDGDPITFAHMVMFNVTDNVPVYSSPVWAARTDYTGRSVVRPTVPNGLRYDSNSTGRSGPRQPVWPTVNGAAITDNDGMAPSPRSTAIPLTGSVLKPGGTLADATWYECTTAGTTAATAPAYPVTPGVTVTDGTAVFTCRGTVTWVCRSFQQSSGYPADQTFGMAISADGRSVSSTLTGLTFGRRYRWACRATDNLLWSIQSDPQTFTYAQVPEVTLKSPQIADPVNLIQDPSFEDAAFAWWVVTDVAGQAVHNKIGDGAALSGTTSMRLARTAATTAGGDMTTPMMAVNATSNHLLYGWFKKESGITNTTLRLDCYNATGTLLGSVLPDSIALANGVDVPQTWTRYGGWVGPNVAGKGFPAGTTQCKVVAIGNGNQIGALRMDAFFFGETDTDRSFGFAKDWFGYADGDFGTSDYAWLGVPRRSQSRINNVATENQLTAVISYASGQNAAKASDRVILEKWTGTAWIRVADTGHVAGARTDIPIPDVLTNQSTYRMQIEVRDASGLVGSTPWTGFDTRMDGPSEVSIDAANVDRSRATIEVRFTPVQPLSALAFGGYEIAFQEQGGDLISVAIVKDPNARRFVWEYPAAGVTYDLMIRQIEVAGANRLEGRWTKAQVRNDYNKWWIKSVKDPALSVQFDVLQEDEPTDSATLDWTELRAWGETQPTHFPDEGRPVGGSLTVRILDGDPQADEKIRMFRRLRLEPDVVCILGQLPSERTFCVIDGFDRKKGSRPYYLTYTLSWKTSKYIEDVRTRDLG